MRQRRADLCEIRACMAAVRGDLLNPTPEALQARLPALAAAIEQFCELSGFGAGDLGDLRRLAADLAACRKLSEHGLAMTQAMAGILAGANAGYSSTGAPSPLAARSRVSLEA
jgi:hypothetical protein